MAGSTAWQMFTLPVRLTSEHELDLLGRDRADAGRPHDAGDVGEHVGRAERIEDMRDRIAATRVVAHVDRDAAMASAEARRRRFRSGAVDIQHRNAGAVLGE